MLRYSLLSKAQVAFLDVGQGDAAIISSRDNTIVVDGGPNFTLDYHLDNKLPFYFCHIDYVVISHPHFDHIAGINRVVRRCKVTSFIYFDTAYRSKEWDKFKNILAKNTSLNVYKGIALQLSDKEIIAIHWPPKGYNCKDINECSVVMSYEFSLNKSVLLTGDVGAGVMDQLTLKTKPFLVKLPHHGGNNTVTEDFLAANSPFIGVISFGVPNSYGHPSTQTLNLLSKYRVNTVKTSQGSYLVKFKY